METPDPWSLAVRLGVTIHREYLDRARGYTDGTHTIWLCKRLTWVEARCTLAHELVHIIYGHVGEQPPAVERHVRHVVARDLIPWDNLLNALGEDLRPEHVAEALDVTVAVLRDRLECATIEERRHLAGRGSLVT